MPGRPPYTLMIALLWVLVMVAPAAGFYSTPGIGKNQVRIAYVLKKNDLLAAVNIIKHALEVYNKG